MLPVFVLLFDAGPAEYHLTSDAVLRSASGLAPYSCTGATFPKMLPTHANRCRRTRRLALDLLQWANELDGCGRVDVVGSPGVPLH
jgi:hypothetical protein